MLRDTFVDAFVAAANEQEALLLHQSPRRLLRKTLSRGGEKNDRCFFRQGILLHGVADGAAKQRFDRDEKRLRLQNHSFTAAERAIVHSAMTIFRKFAQILHVNLHNPGFRSTTNYAVAQRADEEVGENGDEIKPHQQIIPLSPPAPILYIRPVPKGAGLR